MKIGSRFWLAAVTAVALVVAVSLVLYASSQRFSAAEAKREEITELLQQINSLSHLTIDYLLQPSPGVKQQWLGVQEDLTASLGRRPFTEPERVAVVAGIRERVERMGSLFEDLAASSGASGAANRGATELQREKRRVIGSFLQIAMHETAADILYLHALADGDVNRAQAYARSMILVLVFTAGLVVCGLVFTLHRSVVGPLAALHRGVAAVSAGDLGFRTCSLTRDEIGDLARSFDAMLDELQKRSGELSAANAELRLHRNHLERLVEERTQEVRRVSDHLAAAQAMAHLGSWQWDAAQDQITGSAEFYRLFGVQPERLVTYADFNALLHPDDREHVRLAVEEAFARKALYQTEYRVPHPDGGCSQIQARGELTVDEQGRPRTMVGTCLDITERKQREEALRRANTDLARSNLELEQFAYVASHDLQEPLRMVASYTQLLAQRYAGQLDEKARKYIDYAVDGAVRMQGLINDLLDFSRIGTRGKPLEPTDARAVLAEALHNLAAAIAASRAIVTADELPTLRADASQLELVFQNLIGNAVKFRGEREPRVHVGIAEAGGEWVFSVKDNGIGIETQYAERIFVIFQRLHTREEYPGTGIGLAVCKRIVERHGGRIWFESEPGQGSTFFFTIPK